MLYLLLALANFIFIPNRIFKLIVAIFIIIMVEIKRKNGNATKIAIVAEFLAVLMLLLVIGGYLITFILR